MSDEMSEWWRIEAPHFTCALQFRDGVSHYGPPILRWTKGKPVAWLQDYCRRMGWKMERLR